MCDVAIAYQAVPSIYADAARAAAQAPRRANYSAKYYGEAAVYHNEATDSHYMYPLKRAGCTSGGVCSACWSVCLAGVLFVLTWSMTAEKQRASDG